jgi:condensin complex subunit 2
VAENVDGEVDENFWAHAAANQADIGDLDAMGTLRFILEVHTCPSSSLLDCAYRTVADPSTPTPFESHFFNDPDDDGGDFAFVDDALDGVTPMDGEEHDDLWAGTQGQQLKRPRPENVNFAKKAKRVDVKRLKDDIWTGLKSLVPDPQDGARDIGDDTVRLILPTSVGNYHAVHSDRC